MKPYRIRTFLRINLPWKFSFLFPKGKDCGWKQHEWYKQDIETLACYHCKQLLH